MESRQNLNSSGFEAGFESKWNRGRIRIQVDLRQDLNPNGIEAEFKSKWI